jgi:hypothetical protein
MTRSVDQFEINEEKEFRRFVDPEELRKEDQNVVEKNGEVVLSADHPTVTFRHVSRNDDTRTMIATMLPESDFVYCKGYIHAVDHESGTTVGELFALLAYFNSFICDWWTRRIVDRHVTSPAINNLPIPEWDDEEIHRAGALAAELIRRGGIQSLPGGHIVPEDTGHGDIDRDEIQARIESIVSKGFDLEREELNTVLSDFSTRAASDDLRDRIRELAVANLEEAASPDQDND